MEKPRITKETLSKAALDDWKDEFWVVYETPDLQRDLHQTWSMAYEDATRVGEAIREINLVNCLKYLAHTFCWIASFVKKLEKDDKVPDEFRVPWFEYQLSEIVWYKYPEHCPTCFHPTCMCPLIKREDKPSEKEQRKQLAEFRKKPAPDRSMNSWGEMFERIYDGAHFIRSLDELGFHLLEEMGEVEEVIRKIATWDGKDRKKRRGKERGKEDLSELQLKLVEEVADTVSWCFSIVRKISRDAERYQKFEEKYGKKRRGSLITPSLTLSQVLWKEYQRKGHDEIGCHECGNRPCTCPEARRAVTWVTRK